jgi:hypothetical protein
MLIKTTDFRITAPALLFEPGYYVFDVALDSNLTKFLLVDENLLGLAPFIDNRFEPLAQARFAISTRELSRLERMHQIKRPQSAFIFHHAFVCSTLLARCLNQIDAFFSLKEPWILRRLADIKRSQRQQIPRNQWREMFTCYLGLLAKNYQTGRTPVIKVTNVANNLVADVLRYLPGQKILYLYSDLESFLVSNLKKPRETQEKMPDLAVNFLFDGDFAQRFPAFSNVPKLNFLQVCALIWLVNLYNFKHSVAKFDQSNIKTLEMTDFLTNMAECLQNLSRFFGHEASPNEIEQMMDPSVTETDAKHQDKVYGRQSKQQETAQVLDRHSVEIGKTIKWIKPLIEKLGILEFCRAHQLGG